MITFVYLPNNRWCIRCNGINGPPERYEQFAFWPNTLNPELIGHTMYYYEEKVWFIKQQEKVDKCEDRTI